MNTVKTIVVTATLLAVGYGANIVLNKPAPTDDTMEASTWTVPGFEGGEESVPEIPSWEGVANPGASENPYRDPDVALASADQFGASAGLAADPQVFSTNPQTLPELTPPQSQIPGLSATADPVSYEERSAIPFSTAWEQAQGSIEARKYDEALYGLSAYYRDPTISETDRSRLIDLLDQLAGSVLYASEYALQPPHIVRSGDTWEQLGQQYQVPPEFLRRVNGLPPHEPLVPGQSMKVVQGPFRGELDLHRRELTLFLGPYYAGRFNVSIGRDFPTDIAALQVGAVGGPRPYLEPTTGQTIPAGAPQNPYGAHWIELTTGSGEPTELGLHSVGAAVDNSDTRGCLSVSPRDAEDLQAILGQGSEIRVVP